MRRAAGHLLVAGTPVRDLLLCARRLCGTGSQSLPKILSDPSTPLASKCHSRANQSQSSFIMKSPVSFARSSQARAFARQIFWVEHSDPLLSSMISSICARPTTSPAGFIGHQMPVRRDAALPGSGSSKKWPHRTKRPKRIGFLERCCLRDAGRERSTFLRVACCRAQSKSVLAE